MQGGEVTQNAIYITKPSPGLHSTARGLSTLRQQRGGGEERESGGNDRGKEKKFQRHISNVTTEKN